jgi:2-iminobutanoate/2-iminopropanoate deaminase
VSKHVVQSDGAPKAIGPYSQAIRVSGIGELIFCSGQIGTDPATQELVPGGVEPETKRALENLSNVLRASGLAMGDIVKTTVYLADMGDFQKVNTIYAGFFLRDPPARTTVGVAALPRNARVEIEAIAVRRT